MIVWNYKHSPSSLVIIKFFFLEIIDQNFHFVHFNYAVETEEKETPPCEVGVIKYSLLRGIIEHYHEFINPGTHYFRLIRL